VPSTANVAFANPDRQQFFKRYGFGMRVTTYDAIQAANPPGTYTVTIGQDETRHRRPPLLRGWPHFDVFFPMPVSVGGFKFLYLFGTAATRLHGARDYPRSSSAPWTTCRYPIPG